MTGVDAVDAWVAAGAVALCGFAGGPALAPPPGVAARATALGGELGVDVAALVAERAAYAGLSRRGDVSAGGAARLVGCAGGLLAVNLPRPEDLDAVAAWLEADAAGDPWAAIVREARRRRPSRLVERAVLLGLAVAREREVGPPPCPVATVCVAPGPPLRRSALVVDLSSLWAGPLCTRLLAAAGAEVVKVESRSRPDGARRGTRAFFDALNAHKASVALDLASAAGRDALAALVERADVVVEGSRPRALRQLGVDRDRLVRTGPRVWVSITGYGRDVDRIAFGDDAAVAGGLVARDGNRPCFAFDAAADPLTGVAAAAAVAGCLAAGGRWVVDAAMARVAAFVAGDDAGRAWTPVPAAPPPAAPAPAGVAPDLGADNARFGLDPLPPDG